MCTEKEISGVEYFSQPCGKSYFTVKCPFCFCVSLLQAWSKHKGVRCSICNALLFERAGEGFYGRSEVKE